MISEYFNPVELDKPDIDYLANEYLFCRNITIHTPDHPVKSLQKYDVALIGIDRFKTGKKVGNTDAPNLLRSKLYELYKIDTKTKIVDLGNFKSGKSVHDIYFGLRDVLIELHNHKIVPVIFGGSEDLMYATLLLQEFLQKSFSFTSVNNKLNFNLEETDKEISPSSFMNPFFQSPYLFSYSNLGHQACFISRDQLDFLEEHNHDSLRLGAIRYNTLIAEPYLRDASVVSVDINSIKHSDAPGQLLVSPNGFYGEEVCQLSKYAGMSDEVSIFGLSGYHPDKDINHITAALGAQIIWYFLDGLTTRKNEKPAENKKNLKKYIVQHKLLDQPLTFYRSIKTDRWWIEVPGKEKTPLVIACSEDDYQNACNEEIPSRWWKFHQKINS